MVEDNIVYTYPNTEASPLNYMNGTVIAHAETTTNVSSTRRAVQIEIAIMSPPKNFTCDQESNSNCDSHNVATKKSYVR